LEKELKHQLQGGQPKLLVILMGYWTFITNDTGNASEIVD